MKWRRKQQQPPQQQQQEQRRSSSAFSFSQALLHGGWLSKLKQSFVGKTNATKLNQKPASKNSDNPARVTTVSDHISFNSSSLGHFIASEDLLPPRHSYCGGEDEVPCFNCRRHRRRRRGRRRGGSFGSGCEEGSGYEPDNFPFSSCRRGCRSDLSRSRSEKFETNVSDNGRTKISGNLDRSENFLPGVKPIQTSVIDRKYPDQDPMDLCQARKSMSGKMRRRNKVKVNSPRLTVRKKKAAKLEEPRTSTRKARLRKLESFAVVKCSLDPQKDFRDSMVEMISENRIARPEELESLLACYLSLNSDEYHDVIVKVFRQVWFDLNPDRLVPKSENRENTMKHRSKTIRR